MFGGTSDSTTGEKGEEFFGEHLGECQVRRGPMRSDEIWRIPTKLDNVGGFPMIDGVGGSSTTSDKV